jgi:outer membrane protein insertion porin family
MKRVRAFFGTILVAAFLAAPGRAAAEATPTIGDVVVEGNRFVKTRAVLSKVKARRGNPVTDPAFRADVDRLLETGQYDDVQVAVEEIPGEKNAEGAAKVRVIFRVAERPVVRRIDIKGNQALKDGKLRENMSSKVEEPYDRFKAAQDAARMQSVCKDEGYLEARVESYISLDPRTHKVILTFFVTEGTRVLVDEVRVAGAEFFSPREVRKLLKKTRRKKVFKEDALQEDVEGLVRAYRDKGFLEVQVDAGGREFNEAHTQVAVILAINEGRRYTVGSFAFQGAELYTEPELRKAVTLRPGKLYEQSKMDESLRQLHDLYADRGFLRAEIVPDTKTAPVDEVRGTVDVTFSIVESSAVYVDRIYVDGNTVTKEFVIRREVLLKPGDVFSAGKMRQSVERIYNLGFLDDVQVDVQQPRSPDHADIVFSVKEGKPGIVSAGAGFSSLDGLVGTLQVQHINFLGRAQRVNVMWEFGRKKQNYQLGWTDPWFLGKRMSFGVDLFDTVRTLPFQDNSFAYKKGNRGFGVRLGPRLTDTLSLIENYNYERVRVYDVDPEFVNNVNPLNNIEASDDIKSAFTTGLVLDTRDNYFDASRGGRYSGTVEYAGGPFGGDLHFYKPEISLAKYFPTFWRFVFTLAARGAFIENQDPRTALPFSELFRIGGVDTVRGYDIGEVGVDGGRAFTVFNAEYKFPIVSENKKTILQGAFFADLGGCWARVDNVNMSVGSGPAQMKSGVGFGIRFKTPVFPIRLDWGWGLNHRPDQPKSQFYFTIGNIF